MDEPTGGLDPLVRKTMMKILKQFVENGKNSVLFSTHITSDLEKIADHILFLHRGKMEFDGSLKELLAGYRTVCGQMQYLAQMQDRLISWEAQDGSFTGLAETEDCIGLPEQISVKDASIEEIMLGVISGKGDAER